MQLQTPKDIEKSTGLIYAGTTQACGMPIDVFTKDGNLPSWSRSEDPAPLEQMIEDNKPKPVMITVYVLTEKGVDALSKYDKSITDEKYTRSMKALEVIKPGKSRQIDLAKQLDLPQQKVWYLVNKLESQGLITTAEVLR